jgi:hypothetical protein
VAAAFGREPRRHVIVPLPAAVCVLLLPLAPSSSSRARIADRLQLAPGVLSRCDWTARGWRQTVGGLPLHRLSRRNFAACLRKCCKQDEGRHTIDTLVVIPCKHSSTYFGLLDLAHITAVSRPLPLCRPVFTGIHLVSLDMLRLLPNWLWCRYGVRLNKLE